MPNDEGLTPDGRRSTVERVPTKTALVLSGGGVRGAYEVGVVAGIVEALGAEPRHAPPFGIFAGTSVGAINAAYLAAAADRADLGVAGLIELWTSLRLDVHVRLNAGRLLSPRRWFGRSGAAEASPLAGSILDAAPLERLVGDKIAWPALHRNVRDGRVRALIVAALQVTDGRTTMFAEVAPGVAFNPSRDPRRAAHRCEIGRDHVLASAAIPLLFPTRRIAGAVYCDGGLRFNTPLAPAIRVGAERLVVVSVLPTERPAPCHQLGVAFLAGKLLNALLADPIVYDLQVLDRFNRVVEVLEASLDGDEMERVQKVLVEMRGERYRRIETLVFHPSRDIGLMAGEHLRRVGGIGHGLQGHVMAQVLRWSGNLEADWASYLLFDGDFAAELIELGRADARARGDDIRRFFG